MRNKCPVVIEKAKDGSASAYVPDLPGCFAAGDSVQVVERLIAGAIEFHIEGLREKGEPVPEPVSDALLVEVR